MLQYPHVLMTRSKASKDSSRGFQVSSEISFLISARKAIPTSGQTIVVTFDPKIFTNNTPQWRLRHRMDYYAHVSRLPKGKSPWKSVAGDYFLDKSKRGSGDGRRRRRAGGGARRRGGA